MNRASLGMCIAIFFGFTCALWTLTQGFTAFSEEDARIAQANKFQPRIPPLVVTDQSGKVFEWRNNLAQDGRVAIVDFIYTQCNTICSVLGASFADLQAQIKARGLEKKVRLISVSFDPARDTPQAIQAYAQRMQSDNSIWTILTPHSYIELDAVKKAFGVIVIPAPLGEFQHNAAFHWVSSNAELLRIQPLSDAQNLLPQGAR